MRALIIGISIVMMTSSAVFCASEPVLLDKKQLVGDDIPKQYRPDYPFEARRRRETGSGVFILHIDRRTGAVTSITVQKSTGHKLLDSAVLAACIHWRFKPQTVTDVRVPITYGMRGTQL